MPTGPFDRQVVLAVAPYHLAALLPELAPAVAHFEWEPIVTSYFRYPATECGCPRPCSASTAASLNGCSTAACCATSTALIAAVISARGRHLELPIVELERAIHAEIARIVPGLAATPEGSDHHRKARHLRLPAEPDTPRGAHRPARPLADYVAGDYPATLEGAVRSGVTAAHHILGDS
jgi:hypothetical protein